MGNLSLVEPENLAPAYVEEDRTTERNVEVR